MNLPKLIRQWSHNHWSIDPPSDYRLHHQGKVLNVGEYFSKNVAEFNLAWALCHGEISTAQDVNFVKFHMSVFKTVLDEPVDDYPLREWICMMQPAKLDQWLARPSVDRSVRKMIRPTVRLAIKIQDKVKV